MLLNLQNQEEKLSMPEFLALAFQKEYKNPESYQYLGTLNCFICSMEIEDKSFGIQMKNCDHHVHKTCLSEALISDE